MTLRLLDPSVAKAKGAACLAGSPPGYYYRESANKTAFKIHLQGGGWCFSAQDCYWRSQQALGDSSFWLPVSNGTALATQGLLSNDPAINPRTHDWTDIYVMYCNGASWTSNQTDPLVYNGTELWFRGRANLRAVLEDIDERWGLFSKETTYVVLTGTSAGGLGTYVNADFVASLLHEETSFVAAPDAGMFLDVLTYKAGVPRGREQFSFGYYSLWGSRGTTNDECEAALSPSEQWKCIMPQYVVPYVKSRIYAIQSMYDKAQFGGLFMGLPCHPVNNTPGDCSPAEVAFFQQHHEYLKGNLSQLLGASDGGWLTACYQHEESCRDADWAKVKVQGTTDAANFEAYLLDGPGARSSRKHLLADEEHGVAASRERVTTGGSSQWFKVDGPWPGNPTCQYGIDHGWC